MVLVCLDIQHRRQHGHGPASLDDHPLHVGRVVQSDHDAGRAIAEALDGLPPIKMHCSVLAADALRTTLADYYTRRGELQKAAALTDEDVEDPEDSLEARLALRWDDFARMVRALHSAYPHIEPLDLSATKLLKMILKLPGFDDNPDAASEEQLEKLQLAWHEVRSD